MRQTAGIRKLKISEDGLSSTNDLGFPHSWMAVRRVRRSSVGGPSTAPTALSPSLKEC